jgi:histone-lysine N-methyltransferase SETMAR
MLRLYAEHNVEGIAMGDQSSFLYTTYTDSLFAASAAEAVPRTRQNISVRKTMVAIFFTSIRLLVLNSLPKGTKFNRNYFNNTVLQNLSSEKAPIASRKGLSSFSVHNDNSTCHNGAKITEKLAKKHIARAPHPPYSLDVSPCDLRLFEILKEKMKDTVFRSEEQIFAAITKSWNELTFEDIQKVFENWMEGLIWVIAHCGENYP